jgi:hypothetical protein
VAEGKRDANINGYLGYCPQDSAEYSNQVICYPHGCWALPGALEGAGFLWLYPQDTKLWKGAWNEGHLDVPRWIERAGRDLELLRHWIDTERAATGQWRTATWEDLVAQVSDLQDAAAKVIAKIISTWLARKQPASQDPGGS